jgi:hypothetical protein
MLLYVAPWRWPPYGHRWHNNRHAILYNTGTARPNHRLYIRTGSACPWNSKRHKDSNDNENHLAISGL